MAKTREPEPQTGDPRWPPVLVGSLFGLALLAIVQFGLWYDVLGLLSGNANEAEFQRRTALLLLFSPDRLLEIWSGDNVAYFSLIDRTPVLVAAIAILAGAWLAGRLALQLLGVQRLLDRLERVVFAVAVGLNLLSLYALIVGLAGGLQSRWLFFGPTAALYAYGVVSAVLAWRGTADGEPAARFDPAERPWLWWLLAAAPFAAIMVLGAILPPYEYDVREYHLQVPKEWFQQGRITFLPHNIYGNMPLGSELTSLWGMTLWGGDDAWWWGAIVGKTVMACYSLVTLAGLVALGRRVHSLAAGVLAALAYASTPWITQVSLVGYNEGPTALYFLTAFHALWLAWKSPQRAEANRLIALGGFLAGAAVACKYPPALFLVVPLTAWLALGPPIAALARVREGENPRWLSAALSAAIFLGGVAAGCGPWLAKNAILTGNPVYPLLYGMFGGETRTPEKDAQWTRAHAPQPDANGRRFAMQRLASDLVWNLWRAKGASLMLLPLVLAAWLAAPQRGLVALVSLWLLFIVVAWWLLTHRLDRFLVPVLPLVALLAGIGAVALPYLAWRRATLGVLLLGMAVSFPFASLFMGDHRYFAPLDGLRRDDIRLNEITGKRIDIAHRWLNAHVPPGKKVLLVGDAEPFDLEPASVYNTCFDDCQFARLFQNKTRDERLAALQAENISHVFISWAHLARYASPGNYGYTSDYITPELVHRELVADQRLLEKVNVGDPTDLGLPADAVLSPELGEIFAVADR